MCFSGGGGGSSASTPAPAPPAPEPAPKETEVGSARSAEEEAKWKGNESPSLRRGSAVGGNAKAGGSGLRM